MEIPLPDSHPMPLSETLQCARDRMQLRCNGREAKCIGTAT